MVQAGRRIHSFTARSRRPVQRRGKVVFWGSVGAGLAASISGLLLLFPFYITDIFGMQIAQVVHSIIAVPFIGLILGHIYIGTLGMEGRSRRRDRAESTTTGPKNTMVFD